MTFFSVQPEKLLIYKKGVFCQNIGIVFQNFRWNFRIFVRLFLSSRVSKILLFWRFFSLFGLFSTQNRSVRHFLAFSISVLVPFKKEKRFLDWNKNWQKFGLDGFSVMSATSVLQLALCCHLSISIQPNSVGYNGWRRRQGCLCIQGIMAIVTLDCNKCSKYVTSKITSGLTHRLWLIIYEYREGQLCNINEAA